MERIFFSFFSFHGDGDFGRGGEGWRMGRWMGKMRISKKNQKKKNQVE